MEGCTGFSLKSVIFIYLMVFLQYGVTCSKIKCEPVMKCPQQLQGNEWQLMAEDHCGYGRNSSFYHCVQEQVSGYVQLCIQPIVAPKGYYVLWSEAGNKLYPEPCPRDRYQEVDMLSNKFYECEKKKSSCDEPGMLASDCDDGGTTRDRMCRCDYMKDFVADVYALSNVNNETCFSPSTASGGCTYLPCGKNQVMNKAYKCIDKCKDGYYMPDMSMECVPIPVTYSTTSSSTLITLNTTTLPPTLPVSPEITEMVGNADQFDNLSLIRWIVTVLSILVALFMLRKIVWRRFILKKYAVGKDLRKLNAVKALRYKEALAELPDEIKEYNISSSVGIVYAKDTKSNFTGTGFLIRNNYVVTAFHVLEDIFFNLWVEVLEDLKDVDSGIEDLEKAKKISEKEHKKDRILKHLQSLNITKVKEKLKDKTDRDKIQRLEEQFYDRLKRKPDGFKFKIVFDLLEKEDSGTSYDLSLDTKYISVDDDIVILPLLDTKGVQLRGLYISDDEKDLKQNFDIYGFPHPSKVLKVDRNCEVSEKDAVKWLCKDGKKFFQDQKYRDIRKKDIRNDYYLKQGLHYFHCSVQMVHGSSGAPGITYKRNKHDGKVYPVVVCMLIRGHPKFAYSEDIWKVLKRQSDKGFLKYLIEEGATFKKCAEFISKPTDLFTGSGAEGGGTSGEETTQSPFIPQPGCSKNYGQNSAAENIPMDTF